MVRSHWSLTSSTTADIKSVDKAMLSEYDQRFTWSDADNFDSAERSSAYLFTNMFDGSTTSFYGATGPNSPPSDGRIIWNPPAGANLSGSVWLCAGDKVANSSYASPIVYINGSATPAELNSKTSTEVGLGFHIYEFKNVEPVTKIEIAPDPSTLNAIVMSIGFDSSWLIDAGIDASTVNPKVVPNDIETDNILLNFPGDVSTNPDLQYFLPGDMVQNNWNQTETWTEAPIFNDNGKPAYSGRDVIKAFDGTIGMSAADGAMPNSGHLELDFYRVR